MKKVFKFGGTSIDCLQQILKIVFLEKDVIICVSAFSGVTSLIKELLKNKDISFNDFFYEIKNIHQNKIKQEFHDNFMIEKFLLKELDIYLLSQQSDLQKYWENLGDINCYDQLIGLGERLSAYLLSQYLKKELLNIQFLDLSNLITENISKSSFSKILSNGIKKLFSKYINNNNVDIIVTTGFFNYVPDGILNLIDHGYTDFSAAMIASVLDVNKLVIFKDVDGIFNIDPRLIKMKAGLISELSYIELLKMTSGGMKAVNTEAVLPAMKKDILIEVRNTFQPDMAGTRIIKSRIIESGQNLQNISLKKGVCIIRFGGFQESFSKNLEKELILLLDKYKLKKFFSTSDYAGTSVVLPESEYIELLVEDLKKTAQVKINYNCAIIAFTGEEMVGNSLVLAKTTEILNREGINIEMVAQGASEVGVDLVIKEKDLDHTIQLLYKNLF